MSMAPVRRILKPILDWVAEIQIVDHPLWLVTGNTDYAVKGKHMREVMSTLTPGDILFRRQASTLGTKVIPGYYSHCGVAVSSSRVVHAVGKGVLEDDVLDFMKTDAIAVMRITDPLNREFALEQAADSVGRPYDYIFDSDDKRALYCSELVMYCYPMIFPVRQQKRDGVSPDELIGHRGSEMLYESHPRNRALK